MPTVSSRTPEGSPNKCPLCGADIQIEPSIPTGDAPCPNCGGLLWFAVMDDQPLLFGATESRQVRQALQRLFSEHLGVGQDKISPDLHLKELGADSLDSVELVMALEEEFDLNIPETDAARIQTVAQAIAYILQHRRQRGV